MLGVRGLLVLPPGCALFDLERRVQHETLNRDGKAYAGQSVSARTGE